MPWKFERFIASDPDQCAVVVGLVLQQLERFEWTNRDIFAVHMSLEEGILNAIRHGNQCCTDKQVHLIIEIDGENFYARISDEGKGFCLEDVPDPTREENLEKTSGRGVMLIKTFMDRVIYNAQGNSVEFFKRKAKPTAAAGD